MQQPFDVFRIWYYGKHDKLFTRFVRFVQRQRNKLICLFDRSVHRINDNTVILATANSKGESSARVVLLKDFSNQGFEFYTNYDSKKGKDLLENPHAEMLFFWPYPLRQIRISGIVKKLPREQSIEYWNSRPRESQISGYVSAQSSEIESFEELKSRVKKFKQDKSAQSIECPDNWGGYQLVPENFEFWQGKLNRLHERTVFKLSKGKWVKTHLQP